MKCGDRKRNVAYYVHYYPCRYIQFEDNSGLSSPNYNGSDEENRLNRRERVNKLTIFILIEG